MAESTEGDPIGHSRPVGWAQWADGSVWLLRRGEDFEQSPYDARRAFLSWSSRRGFRTHTQLVDDSSLKIQVVLPVEEESGS